MTLVRRGEGCRCILRGSKEGGGRLLRNSQIREKAETHKKRRHGEVDDIHETKQ